MLDHPAIHPLLSLPKLGPLELVDSALPDPAS
jgi:hypothetical protein